MVGMHPALRGSVSGALLGVLALGAVVLGGLLVVCPVSAQAEEAQVTVPDVRRRRTEDARRVIEAAGLKVGTIYEASQARILRDFRVRTVLGTVFFQKPSPGSGWPANKPVDLIVVAAKDGKLPPDMPGVKANPPTSTPAEPPAKAGAKLPAVPPSGFDGPRDDPLPPPPPAGDAPAGTAPRGDAPVTAEGSPDAPRKAAKPDPNRVPELIGLDLTEAEMLVRDSKMKLHVERVEGHPVGKVLEQQPSGGAKRPPGGMIRVVITAGGDFETRVPNPPAVYVSEIGLPSLLDRTKLQAGRIAEALGLRVAFHEAKNGMAGRVVRQKPAAGAKIAKGAILELWIGPGGAEESSDKPLPLGPLGAKPGDAPAKGEAAKGEAAKKGATKADPNEPLAPGPLKAGIPKPISPGVNTEIPPNVGGKAVPVGFTWRGVPSANAYLLEVEEMGAEGRWLPLARKPARATAVLLDVERLDPKGASRLRWRVTAVIGGRRGTPSGWTVLK